MGEKTFLLAFDGLNHDHDYAEIKKFIKSSDDFSAWWNYIPFVFLVKTELTPQKLAAALRQVTDDTSFLVIAVDPSQSDGFLPRRAWQWIKRREKEQDLATKE